MEDELRKLILCVQEFLALKFSIKTSKNQQRQIMLHYFCRGKKYGETADECAEAFFYYGKSLLELARYATSCSRTVPVLKCTVRFLQVIYS